MGRSWAVFWLVGSVVLLASLSAPAREWTDRTGTYRIEAELVSVRGGKVYLERRDGQVVPVPLERMSIVDLRYLASLPECRAYFESLPAAERESLLGPGYAAGPAGPATGTTPSPPAGSKTAPSSPPEAAKAPAAPTQGAPPWICPDVVASKVGEVGRFTDLGWGIEALAFSPDGRFLAAGKVDSTLLLFDLVRMERVASVERMSGLGSVKCVAFTPDGRKLLSGGSSGRIEIWEVSPEGALRESGRFAGHSHGVLSITVSASGTHVLSGGNERNVRCWTLSDAREQFVVDGFSRPVKATFITRGGKQGLASDGRLVVLIDMKEGKAIQTMALGSRVSQAVAIAPDGSRIVVNDGYALHSWTIKAGRGDPILQNQELTWVAAFLPNSRYLLSGASGKVNLWDLTSHRKIHEFDVAREIGHVEAIAASPDNRHFAAIPSMAGQDLQIFRMSPEVAQPPSR